MESVEEKIFLVGVAGWAYEDWKGIVYPKGGMKKQHPLELLSSWFDTVEVNSTFYHPPNPRYCASWLKKVEANPRFRFTAKIWDRFTHKRHSWPEEEAIDQFKAGIAPLKEAGRLGALLLQFPWSFKRSPENRQWLARLVETFEAYPMALEVRHSSWDQSALYAGLRERNIAFCNIDQPIFNDSIAPSAHVTAPFAYVRFHGRNKTHWFRKDSGRNERYNYCYQDAELAPWIQRIRAMKPQVNEMFIVTNNHYRGQAVVNALEIQAALGGAKPALPHRLIQEYPHLAHIFQLQSKPPDDLKSPPYTGN